MKNWIKDLDLDLKNINEETIKNFLQVFQSLNDFKSKIFPALNKVLSELITFFYKEHKFIINFETAGLFSSLICLK